MTALIGKGKVEYLCVNGMSADMIDFSLDGPKGDAHATHYRNLNGHDGDYIRTSALQKGDRVLNWRTWTGLSIEETAEVEKTLGINIPQGCLLENMGISGIPKFSQLAPTTRLVFPERMSSFGRQVILATWEENGPCRTVGERLEQHHGKPGLKAEFVAAAQHKRGIMGLTLAGGRIWEGDTVLVYPPVN